MNYKDINIGQYDDITFFKWFLKQDMYKIDTKVLLYVIQIRLVSQKVNLNKGFLKICKTALVNDALNFCFQK